MHRSLHPLFIIQYNHKDNHDRSSMTLLRINSLLAAPHA